MKKILLAVASFVAFSANAQDVHFTQYFTSPLTLNPANTGLVNCDWRLAGNVRNQWSSINNKPYTTGTISYDMAILKGKLHNDAIGIGVIGLYDQSGTGALTNTTVGLSLAYHKVFGDAEDHPNVLSGGAQMFLVQKSLDYTKLIFGLQYDPSTGMPLNPSGETFANKDLTYSDYNTGLLFTGWANERSTYYISGSMYHMTRPVETFLATSNAPKINSRISASVGGNIQMNDNMMLIASGLYQLQGSANEFVLGAAAGFILNPMHNEFTNNTLLYLGSWYRFGDAVCPYISFGFGKNKIGLSYDVTLSNLAKANQSQGAFEISYIYNGCIPHNETKKYNFACPRF